MTEEGKGSDLLISSSLFRTYLSYHEEGSMSTTDVQWLEKYEVRLLIHC